MSESTQVKKEPVAAAGEAEDASRVRKQLEWAMASLARHQGAGLDSLQLIAAVSDLSGTDSYADVSTLCRSMGLAPPAQIARPDPARLPGLVNSAQHGWVVINDRLPSGSWSGVTQEAKVTLDAADVAGGWVTVSFDRLGYADRKNGAGPLRGNFTQILRSTIWAYRGALLEAVLASFFIGLLTLMTSMFSMQVYDRVIPTHGEYTLLVLGIGVALSILLELAMKHVRSHLMGHVTVGADHRLSREIFHRLLRLRVDQIPASVGSLAGQLRGYEQVRSFFTAGTLFALVDVPMGLVYLVIIAAVASPWVALVPLAFGVISLAAGISSRRKIHALAAAGATHSNLKTGLLVEAVEGAETIKSGSGGWKFLARWIKLHQVTIINDYDLRKTSEGVGYLAAAMQQLGYAGVIVVGALVVMKGEMTVGALIAASILSGRILAPILAIPGLMVQQAHAQAALQGLNKLYELKTDNDAMEQVLVPEAIAGHYALSKCSFAYGPQSAPALAIESLQIRPGERIGVIGAIGSGKSTLLKLLSGLYAPNSGQILVDGLDLALVSRDVINRNVGYLQQEHRLFQGTLRENLLIGIADPGDDVLLAAMRRTGMDKFVSSHSMGLGRPIVEGGKGLSGGQRQLVAFTRLLLTQPQVLLLDEPTANMDKMQEAQCIKVLEEEVKSGRTLVMVTHKPELLPLVDRLLVIVGSQIVLDGPRSEVLRRLQPVSTVDPSERAGADQNGGTSTRSAGTARSVHKPSSIKFSGVPLTAKASEETA